ncbi:hypothetical protein KAS06_00390 [Candidatus Bathyarchaeota archaeon]|nr:hypothetical protein [Candidatus Bathyarchaeota archaeon]
MPVTREYVIPPKSQILKIQGFKDYVERHFGKFSFKEVRYIRPKTAIYNSIFEMHRSLGRLQEGDELGGSCGRLPTGEVVIYLVNKHKRGHKLPVFGLLYEMIHLAKPNMAADEVESETTKNSDPAEKHAHIFAYNATHKSKKPYPK